MKIIIKGKAIAFDENTDKLSGSDLARCDGITDSTEFSEFFHAKNEFGENEQALINAGVTGGYMSFYFEPKEKELYTITEYDGIRELTPEEEAQLIEYTQGQWSDGIGEGFEQREQNGTFISAWHGGQIATLSYE